MTHELINTSVPRGLRPGTSGFCTVVVTADMPPVLEQRLTLLSGYRWVYPPGEADADKNPVSWAHWRVPLVGQSGVEVLSRVADVGFDFSGRSNRIAHHVALDPANLPPVGPAGLLRQAGFMEVAWAGEPRLLAAGRAVPRWDPGPRPCSAWDRAAGDAGWAGVLASRSSTTRGERRQSCSRRGWTCCRCSTRRSPCCRRTGAGR